MDTLFVCPLCGNDDINSIGLRNGEHYCRRCIAFHGEEAEVGARLPSDVEVELDFSLSAEQEKIAKRVKENYQAGKDTLIYAICGAGKTELVFHTVEHALANGHQVGFTIPRRDVVIELSKRLQKAFPMIKVTSVYGGHTKELQGGIIVCTTHQLYRYQKYFDLLIFDEIDAFPYRGNKTLNALVERAGKGRYVILSATPDQTLINKYKSTGEVLELFQRFHGHKLPVPHFIKRSGIDKYFQLFISLRRLLKANKPVLIFVPTINTCVVLGRLLKLLYKGGEFIHSKVEERAQIIERFRHRFYRYLVTTSVLERGVTITNLQVIIFMADHSIYDQAALVQISGRVGRKKEAPTGEVIFIADKKTPAICGAIDDINAKNASVQAML